MKVHKTFSLDVNVVSMLNDEKNQSLYIENLIKADKEKNKPLVLDLPEGVAKEIDRLTIYKSELEKKNAEEEQKKSLHERVEEYKGRRSKYLLSMSSEERQKFNAGFKRGEWDGLFTYYAKEVEAEPC